VLRRILHRIAHLTQWNHGHVETYWERGYLMAAFRCTCGERQGAHRVAHNGFHIPEPK